MPNKQSAYKELRKAKKRTLGNKMVKENIKYLLKETGKLLENKEIDKAKEIIAKAIKQIDKAAQKKIIKKNTAARKKSRLVIKFNKANKEKQPK